MLHTGPGTAVYRDWDCCVQGLMKENSVVLISRGADGGFETVYIS